MKKYVEFTVWNDKEERPATAEEVCINVRIWIIDKTEYTTRCEIRTDEGFSILADD
jgi:hypothetical protein